MRLQWLLHAGALSAPQLHVRAQCESPNQDDILNQLVAVSTYSKFLRPDRTGGPTSVATQLDIQSLMEVNPKLHYFEIMAYWRTAWVDPRLSFEGLPNSECFKRIKLNLTGDVTAPLKSPVVWTPDLYFDNAKAEFYGSYYFWLEPSGKLIRSILIKHQFECKMDFSSLPFDSHHCLIRLLPYSETSAEVTLVEKDGQGITLKKGGNEVTEWLIDTRDAVVARDFYGTGNDTYSWDRMVFNVNLSRSHLYHMRTDFAYTILFVIMSYAGFFISRTAAPARVTIAVIPVLTIVNLLNHIDAQLPRIEYSWLSVFLMTSLVFAVMAVIEYGLVWTLLSMEEDRQERLATIRVLAAKLSQQGPGPRESPRASAAEARVPVASDSRNTLCTRTGLTRAQEVIFKASYRLFDPKPTGLITPARLHAGLRSFNLYYSPEQIQQIFEKMGLGEGQDMPKEQFIEFLVKMPKPSAAADMGFFDRPPSLCLDIITRSAFFVLYSVVVLTMFIWAESQK